LPHTFSLQGRKVHLKPNLKLEADLRKRLKRKKRSSVPECPFKAGSAQREKEEKHKTGPFEREQIR
jgi:hypothetical protein